jgi:L-lactate dehydrogenase complex protein LldG
MASSTVQRFRQSLSRVNATSSVTTPAGFDEALEDTVEVPAVGASLPFSDVSLADQPITLDPGPEALRAATTGVTGSRLGISSLGTVAVESRAAGDELVSLFPVYSVVVIGAADVREDLVSAFEWLADVFDAGRDSVILATGPSATGDMGALVQGVHGPERVHVLVVEEGR